MATISAAGQVVEYMFVATNTGNVTLHDCTLEVLNSLSGPVTLAPGQELSVVANHTVTQADIDAGGVSATAQARSAEASGSTTVDVLAEQRPGLAVAGGATVSSPAAPSFGVAGRARVLGS